MYSFLPPVMPNIATHQHESDVTRGLSLDSANESQEMIHDARSVVDRDYSSDLNDLLVTDTSGCVNPEQQVAHVDNIEIDPNQQRRKRQKLTPVKEKPLTGKEKPVKPKKTAKGTLQASQPQNLDSYIQNFGNNFTVSSLPSVDRTHKDLPTPDESKGSSTYPSQVLQQVSNSISTSQTRGEKCKGLSDPQIQQTVPRPKGTTPKKKAISLHTNGTLLSSPRASPRLFQKIAEVVRQPESGRNMKLKNGKFVQSLPIVIKYRIDDTACPSIADRIDKILVSESSASRSTTTEQSAKTHPFFLGKTALKSGKAVLDTGNDRLATDADQEDGGLVRSTIPTAWKDIKFSSSKTNGNKSVDLVRPIWPPRDIKHVGRDTSVSYGPRTNLAAIDAKHKTRAIDLGDHEDILRNYGRMLKRSAVAVDQTFMVQKHVVSGTAVSNMLHGIGTVAEQCPAVLDLRAKVQFGTSAFDRGEAAGQNIWPLKYAPSGWMEVLQPSCNILHDWLQSLAIHNVKIGLDRDKPRGKDRTIRKKKRQSKMKDELSDFVVDSDDGDESGSKIPNAILITGPSGCGKTASVYAVAKELGFEIFEIHPGMRRSAKDIFDKVGDMTQNHLVHRGEGGSRSSSMPLSDTDTVIQAVGGQAQPIMSSFLGSKKSTKQIKSSEIEATTTKKEQKQSLILFEEVDILFEEDRGFWTGVQSLIQYSKRPVVMTCNDISTIPMDELGLYAVLEYIPPGITAVTEHLTYLAAAEGHIIDRTALSMLYASKRNDLRASITELNLWCQMTVGSKFGGLDWMLQSVDGRPQVNENGEKLRIFSQGTYRTGLDLIPQTGFDEEDNLRFLQSQLGFTLTDWYDYASPTPVQAISGSIAELQQSLDLADAWSALDIVDNQAAPIIAATLIEQYYNVADIRSRENITSLYIKRLHHCSTTTQDFADALEPIMEEKPTFPPSQGRLAPSLDNASSNVATDIAPYVRSIVAFDLRLEQYRNGAFGSQGNKSRNTRAARAAAEGRDKANTRTERWFPRTLDFDRVLRTGNRSWPQWVGDFVPSVDGDLASSQSTIDEGQDVSI